jgi:hypothetical protein
MVAVDVPVQDDFFSPSSSLADLVTVEPSLYQSLTGHLIQVLKTRDEIDTDLKEIGERFEVVIECNDENDQTALLLRLSQEGLRVRAIVI